MTSRSRVQSNRETLSTSRPTKSSSFRAVRRTKRTKSEVTPSSSAPRSPERVFAVVGVGASAGGLEAFSQLLKHIPADANLSLVLVQHLDPTYKSMLTELLSKTSKMPVEEVTSGVRIVKGHVYVIPPNTSMTVSNGVLHLTPRTDGTLRHLPIDTFLRSLAEDEGSRAIGVILSGTALDGIQGLRVIKEAGGVTIAEDEASARYPDLPKSAIRAGVIDFVLTPAGIANELIRLSEQPFAPHLDIKNTDQLLPTDHLGQIFKILYKSTGVDFSEYKHTTIKRRIIRRMTVLRIDKLEHYEDYLKKNPAETEVLFQEILIHVTGFFREPRAFESLKTEIFPVLLKDRAAEDMIRIWIPGCSTGEEAYSVAMALAETMDVSPVKPTIEIFATDVNETVIRKAREGTYSDISDVSAGRQRRFFLKHNGNYQVTKPIRDMVIFAKQNVITDPPFSKMDLIFCRNLMIYLGPSLQRRLVPILHYALKPSGFLVLGTFESISGFGTMFQPLDKKYKIYKKRETRNPSMADIFPVNKYEFKTYLSGHGRSGSEAGPGSPRELDIIKEADRLLLSRYGPASVIVNGDMEIIQFRGQTGLFLEPAPGKASLNLLKMAKEGLMVHLREAIRESGQKRGTIRRAGIKMRTNGKYTSVTLEVTPLKARESYLVAFREGKEQEPLQSSERKSETAELIPKTLRDTRLLKDELGQLQSELSATKQFLQSIIEEKEAANEELKAANEEVQSSNEELQSTNEELETAKEELQSTNEELTTVNEELKNRNDQLGRLIDDLNNVFSSATLQIVILGSDMRIRRTTPGAEKMLNLLPSDMGRTFTDLRLNIDIPELSKMVSDVMETVAPKEFEAIDAKGRWYQVWLRPYRTSDNRTDGVVLAFNDISRMKKVEDHLRTAFGDMEQIVKDQTVQLGSAQRLAGIGETAAMIGHDLRNPLQAVFNLSHLAREKVKGSKDKELIELVLSIQDQARYMDRIVSDLQDYARPMKPKLAEVNLRQLLADTLSSFNPPEKVKVEVDVEDDMGTVLVDPDLMRRALTNLVANAIQALPDGGTVKLKAFGNNSTVNISVHDSGKGLSLEEQEKMFSPLYTTKSKGMGLGLPVAKRIVEGHNGTITFSSEHNNGTTFTIQLPPSEQIGQSIHEENQPSQPRE